MARWIAQADQVDTEWNRLLKQHIGRSQLADQVAATMSIVEKANISPLAMLGKRDIEYLTDKKTGTKLTFWPKHSLTQFDQEIVNDRLWQGCKSIADVSRALLHGYLRPI